MNRRNIFVIIFLILIVLASKSFGAQKNSKEIELFKEYRSALTEERQVLERQVDRHLTSIENILNWTKWSLVFIGTGVIGIWFYFLGRTKRDLQKNIREVIDTNTKEVIETEVELLRQRLRDLGSRVDELASYKDLIITWVLPEELDIEKEIEALYSVGFGSINQVVPASGATVELGEPDIVILSYRKSAAALDLLKHIVAKLKESAPPVYLIIYLYNPMGENPIIERAEKEILQGFYWYVPVNFPTQLLTQTKLLTSRKSFFLEGNPNG